MTDRRKTKRFQTCLYKPLVLFLGLGSWLLKYSRTILKHSVQNVKEFKYILVNKKKGEGNTTKV